MLVKRKKYSVDMTNTDGKGLNEQLRDVNPNRSKTFNYDKMKYLQILTNTIKADGSSMTMTEALRYLGDADKKGNINEVLALLDLTQ